MYRSHLLYGPVPALDDARYQARDMMNQAYEIECNICGELRWPYLPARPASYTCVRCESGAGAAKREAARAANAARKTGPSHPPSPSGHSGR